MKIKDLLIHALTDYDRKQSKKRGYNPHAPGIYFQRIDEVCADIERGTKPRAALLAGFQDRLLDVCLVAIGEPKFTQAEKDGANYVYAPVSQATESGVGK